MQKSTCEKRHNIWKPTCWLRNLNLLNAGDENSCLKTRADNLLGESRLESYKYKEGHGKLFGTRRQICQFLGINLKSLCSFLITSHNQHVQNSFMEFIPSSPQIPEASGLQSAASLDNLLLILLQASRLVNSVLNPVKYSDSDKVVSLSSLYGSTCLESYHVLTNTRPTMVSPLLLNVTCL